MGTQLPSTQKGHSSRPCPHIFRPLFAVAKRLDGSRCHMVWPGRPWPRPHYVRWGLTPPPKGHRSIPTFQPMCRLWPNCYMDQDATWYGGRPRSRLHCVRRGSSSPSPKWGQSSLFGPCLLWSKFKRLESMDQDATWYGGMGLGTGYIALDGDPATAKRGTSPNFRPMSVVAKQLHG